MALALDDQRLKFLGVAWLHPSLTIEGSGDQRCIRLRVDAVDLPADTVVLVENPIIVGTPDAQLHQIQLLKCSTALAGSGPIVDGPEVLTSQTLASPDLLLSVNLEELIMRNAFRSASNNLIIGRCSTLINHSCTPNAIVSFHLHDTLICIRTCQAIKAGEEITLAYINLLAPVLIRKMFLEEFGIRLCKCNRCIAERAIPAEMAQVIFQHADAFEGGADQDKKIAAFKAITEASILHGAEEIVKPALGTLALEAGLHLTYLRAAADICPGDQTSIELLITEEQALREVCC